MNITPEEAQSALNTIKQAKTQASSWIYIWAYYWLIWGAVWAIGSLLMQFEPQWFPEIWVTAFVIGAAGSAIVGARQGSSMRSTPGSQNAALGVRYGIFNGVLYSFAILWTIILPLTPLQAAMFWITIWTFTTIIAGVWFKIPFCIGFGVGMTLLLVFGYYVFPHYFWLWTAVFVGLPLISVGAYYLLIKRK